MAVTQISCARMMMSRRALGFLALFICVACGDTAPTPREHSWLAGSWTVRGQSTFINLSFTIGAPDREGRIAGAGHVGRPGLPGFNLPATFSGVVTDSVLVFSIRGSAGPHTLSARILSDSSFVSVTVVGERVPAPELATWSRWP
jgi:hypothetical protein